jgi:hypothetical protein
MATFKVTRKDTGETATVSDADLMTTCDRMSKSGAFILSVEPIAAPAIMAPVATVAPVAVAIATRAVSTFEKQITDNNAKARIETTHAALAHAGVKVDTAQQLYATGTRMADVGYSTQQGRKAEHDAKMAVAECAAQLRSIVEAERRRDVEISARDFGRKITVNGKIAFDGLNLGEQAIRGLATRLESPMLSYVLGLRDRIAQNVAAMKNGDVGGIFAAKIAADKREIAAILVHECEANPDATLKLRTRQGIGDVFAVLSPGYVPADAPQVVGDLIADLPRDAKGTFAYDATSTAWELRANVWTPTPVEEQAVGEAFEGWTSYGSRDNGTSRFRGGGGVTFLRCLNASTYCANVGEVSRVHRGGIRRDIDSMTAKATSAIKALCGAWGVNRAATVDLPNGTPINVAIPGFWRFLLRDRKSDLVGVLPGRSETHVEGLTRALWAEKRDPKTLVRADFAQGWTRYIQDQPAPVRRDAEAAIGDWLMTSGAKLSCDLKGVSA